LITIGICDDQAAQNELLLRYLSQHRSSAEFDVFQATSPVEFLLHLHERKPDLVFLDIDMAGMNGIELGEAIKRERPETIIVYITGHEEYALEAFRVRAFHYLVKPIAADSIRKVFDECLPMLLHEERDASRCTFSVQKKGEMICIDYTDIYFFEKVGHKIHVSAEEQSISYYGNFAELLGQLEDGPFLQCHQGYIVNIGKVRAFRDKTLFLNGGRQIPVSRSYADLVRDALAKRLFAGKARQ
jgi:DNA-binding LytR/AlgR family response regulator